MQRVGSHPAGLGRPTTPELSLKREIERFGVAPYVIRPDREKAPRPRRHKHLAIDRWRHRNNGNPVTHAAEIAIRVGTVKDRADLLRKALHASARHEVLERRQGKAGAHDEVLEGAPGD